MHRNRGKASHDAVYKRVSKINVCLPCVITPSEYRSVCYKGHLIKVCKRTTTQNSVWYVELTLKLWRRVWQTDGRVLMIAMLEILNKTGPLLKAASCRMCQAHINNTNAEKLLNDRTQLSVCQLWCLQKRASRPLLSFQIRDDCVRKRIHCFLLPGKPRPTKLQGRLPLSNGMPVFPEAGIPAKRCLGSDGGRQPAADGER